MSGCPTPQTNIDWKRLLNILIRLLKIFAIYIENDSDKLHGALICEKHQRLLRKHAAAVKKGKVMTLTVTSHQYRDHDDNLGVISVRLSKPRKQTLTGKDLRL